MGLKNLFKKASDKIHGASEKIHEFKQNQMLRTQVRAEKEAQRLEEKANYNKQLNLRLERQVKAREEIKKTQELKQKLQDQKMPNIQFGGGFEPVKMKKPHPEDPFDMF